MPKATVVCPKCGHRESRDAQYSIVRCSKCGKLYEPKDYKNRTKQTTLLGKHKPQGESNR